MKVSLFKVETVRRKSGGRGQHWKTLLAYGDMQAVDVALQQRAVSLLDQEKRRAEKGETITFTSKNHTFRVTPLEN